MNNFIPLVFDALAEMAAHKLRTLLTLLGMIFLMKFLSIASELIL